MSSKFSTCGVLASTVDYFCLACECRLHNETDANTHIVKPVHVKKFELTSYFEDGAEHVRKIKKWYFCELCNILLSTAARVRLHVVETKHIENRTSRVLQRRGNCVIAFSRIQIDDKAWNGIVDDTCAICNTEFEDENIHKNETNHIIRLIQSKLEFDVNQNIYRRVDEISFQCLTCNTVVSSIEVHFSEDEHKNLYQACCDNFKIDAKSTTSESIDVPSSIKNNNERENHDEKILSFEETTTPDATSKVNEGSKKVSEIIKVDDGNNNVDGNKKVKGDSKIVNDLNKLSVQNNVKSKIIDDKDICEILNAQDYITMDENGQPLCILCNWEMEPITIIAHINDMHHKTMLQMHKERLSKLNSADNLTDTLEVVNTENGKRQTKKNIVKEQSVLDSLDEFQKNNINIHFEFQTAVCKICSKGLDFNMQAIKDHIEKHTKENEHKTKHEAKQLASDFKDTKNVDPAGRKTSLYTAPVLKKKGKQELKQDKKGATKDKKESSSICDIENLKVYAKQNDMTYLIDQSKFYCNRCNTQIISSLISLKEHVSGLTHKRNGNEQNLDTHTKQKQSNKEANLIKVRPDMFIHNVVTIDGLQKELVINEKICINFFSFAFMVNNNRNKLTCLLCDSDILIFNFKEHMANAYHENLINESLVIIHEDEFIRQIKGQFHCGYCNILVSSWDSMENHLQSTCHRESKTAAQWHLQQMLPEIIKKRQSDIQARERFVMQMMFSNMPQSGWNRDLYDSD